MRDGKRGRIAKRISGERPLRRRPIFVFLAVVSVALRRVLVRGGEAAALVSRPAHAVNSRPQRYLNVIPTGANLFLQAKKHVFCVLNGGKIYYFAVAKITLLMRPTTAFISGRVFFR